MLICVYMYIACLRLRRSPYSNGRIISATLTQATYERQESLQHIVDYYFSVEIVNKIVWVFIKGGCSRRGVQWMGAVLYNKHI